MTYYTHKKCTQCYTHKNLSEFSKDKKNKDGLRSMCKACDCKRRREYYKKNKEHELRRNKIYYDSNKDSITEFMREYSKEYRQANSDKVNFNNNKRRALKNKTGCELTENEQFAIKLMYEDASILNYHVDHIVPLSRGGKHHPDNLQIVSPSYNLSKNDKVFNERKYV